MEGKIVNLFLQCSSQYLVIVPSKLEFNVILLFQEVDKLIDENATLYHYYPHNQHLYLLPECASQQVL